MRRTGITLVIVGALFAAGALAFSTMAVPQLVKFPLNTNATVTYTGSMVTYVNARTGATLAKPTSVQLTIDRTVKALSSSNSSVALVSEHVVSHMGATTALQDNIYALNRRTMADVAHTGAYTFAAGNRSASAGSYYVTLPMNIKPNATLAMWKPETGTTYPIVPLKAAGQPASLDGLHVMWFTGTLPMTPVASWDQAALVGQGLPATISPTAVEAQLTSAGVSVPALETALATALSPAELKQLTSVLSKAIPLNYYAYGSGLLGADPKTGAIIEAKNVIDGTAVSPDKSGVNTLITVLSRHTSVKGVPAALTALRGIAAAPPQPVFELKYTESPASIASMVNTAKTQGNQISMVTYDVPIGLAVLGALLMLTGGFVWRRRRTPATAISELPVGVTAPVSAEAERRAAA
jgi:hypothetical protein